MDPRADKKNNSGGRAAACDVEALKKCLEENNGNRQKCQAQIEAFKSYCAAKRRNSYSLSPRPRIDNSVVTEL
ncbi:hypothetical protein M9H77_29997 [Catharanthus roseus]|uniref:Uncharacterized protein n=1 Tax=Catharanthus roseus TaxID=4058 RepID=A0ACB9ZW12_CATRO|nr:hypothetical protein M9H77_29997 [Catharanthus roseus]